MITFADSDIAQRCIQMYNGQPFPGADRPMNLSIAKFKPNPDGGFRGGRGGGGGRGFGIYFPSFGNLFPSVQILLFVWFFVIKLAIFRRSRR